MIKKAASKAFVMCGGLLLLAMLISTIFAAINGGLEAEYILAGPLLGFYTGVYYLIFAYPVLFVGFAIHEKFKSH